MVLDISDQFRRDRGAGEIAPREKGVGLEELLLQASCGKSTQERLRAVEQLRQVVPAPAGVDMLWNILDLDGDPRRAVAARMLGYHRRWLSTQSGLKKLLDLLRRERDSQVGVGLVWCLRRRNEIQEFLLHKDDQVAREAALGLPVNRHTLGSLSQTLLEGNRGSVERILLDKLTRIHAPLVGVLIEALIEREGAEDSRLTALCSRLPQVPLFEIFLEKRSAPDWDPQQDARQAARSKAWRLMASIAMEVLQRSPTVELLQYLFRRSGEDEAFAWRHVHFMRAALQYTDAPVGSELLNDLERLTAQASEVKVARMAQLLVELNARLEGEAKARAAALLEQWKSRSAALKLKIYHMQQGLV